MRTPSYSFGMVLASYACGFEAGYRAHETRNADEPFDDSDPLMLEGEAFMAWRRGRNDGEAKSAEECRTALVL